MKKGYLIALILLVVFVVGLVLFIVWRNIQNSIVDKYGMVNTDNINYVYYTRGGGKDGAFIGIHVKYNETDGSFNYSMEKSKLGNEPYEKIECKVDSALLSDINIIVADNNLIRASKKPLSGDHVLDGATSNLDIRFENGKFIRLDSEQVLSEDEFDACRQIVELLKDEKYRLS